MKKKLLSVALACMACTSCLAPIFAADKPAGQPANVAFAKTNDANAFMWEGSCEVLCSDSCRIVCGAGVVYATTSFEARLQAEASLRQLAPSGGIVKESSIRITIRGGF